MAKATKPVEPAELAADAAEAAAALAARAGKDPFLRDVLGAMHEALRLWRLCRKQSCRRARGCCGDALVCGARRWPAASETLRLMLEAGAKERRKRRGAPRFIDRHLARWTEKGGVLSPPPREIRVTWKGYGGPSPATYGHKTARNP
jgi:hypothetical protein